MFVFNCHHVRTRQLLCAANQLTGFYNEGNFVL